jgi:hypothetical protein
VNLHIVVPHEQLSAACIGPKLGADAAMRGGDALSVGHTKKRLTRIETLSAAHMNRSTHYTKN